MPAKIKERATRDCWKDMKARCMNTKNLSYHYYGGRGIKVCKRWLCSFYNFVEDMGFKPDGLTLDRKNNDSDYKPSNCRWATRKQQAENSRKSKNITVNGVTKNIAGWGKHFGVTYSALSHYARSHNVSLRTAILRRHRSLT